MVDLVVALDTARSGEVLCFVYTMVIKTELWTKVHSPVVRAADCRSASPWFNSGWRHWIHIHLHVPTTMTMPITTIPRKSVNMVAELALWIPDTTERQEDYSAVAKDATTTAVALDTKARAAQGTVVQLKSELAQSQQSRTEAKTQADYLSLIALKPPSDFGADTVVDRIPGRLTGESLDRLSMTLKSQKQPIRLDEDQLTTDITDLEMTEKILDESTATFEDTTQDCLVCQTKVVDFEIYNKSLSEELEVLAKTKDVISEKTDDSEYRDNRSMLSSNGGLAIELKKSENSIGLTQLASRVISTMHARAYL